VYGFRNRASRSGVIDTPLAAWAEELIEAESTALIDSLSPWASDRRGACDLDHENCAGGCMPAKAADAFRKSRRQDPWSSKASQHLAVKSAKPVRKLRRNLRRLNGGREPLIRFARGRRRH